MAAPKVTEAYQKVRNKILVFFDQPLDDTVFFGQTSFSLNYGRVPIIGATYYGTAGILLMLGRDMTYRDKLELNYQPPDNLQTALRAPVADNASDLVIKRNAVRSFYKLPVKNLLPPDDNAWAAMANLGGQSRFVPDGDSPEFGDTFPGFDPCGDGSVIIGNPNNIINRRHQGEILALKNLVGGSGYPDGQVTDLDVVPDRGAGRGAKVSLTVENGSVVGVNLLDGGMFFDVDQVLTLENDPGMGFSIQVAAVYYHQNAEDGGMDPAPPETGTQNTGGGVENPGGGGTGSGGGSGSSSTTRFQDLPYPDIDRPYPRSATPDDFILAYGLKEAIQLSNIDDADATQPNTEKIWMAIEDSCALIDNYITQAGRAGKVLISSNRRRTSLIIARYYLDTVRRREDVKSDYERAISELDNARTIRDITRPEMPWWLDPCNPLRGNGIRSHRIPQYYNGVSGKGLDGYWVDSAAEEKADFRVDGDNSQNNNNMNNDSAGINVGREPEQPTDDGGLEAGGGSN